MNNIREDKDSLNKHKEAIEIAVNTEYQKLSNSGLIDYSELLNLANYTAYYMIKNAVNKDTVTDSYIIKGIKWAIRNEMRRRYKWHIMKDESATDDEKQNIKDAVYRTVLSIDEMADAENPIQIKDNSRTPEQTAEIVELKQRIKVLMKKLSQREQDLIEAKYFYDRKLKDIELEFHISQSRISRIIQNALDKIKKELLKQENVYEDNI